MIVWSRTSRIVFLALALAACNNVASDKSVSADTGAGDRQQQSPVSATPAASLPPPEQQGVRSLQMAADLVQIASFNPQALLDKPPMQGSEAQQRNLRALLPCFQQIRESYQQQLPSLFEALRRLEAKMGHSAPPGQAVDSALAYIRVMHIVESAISAPDTLAMLQDFQLQRSGMAQFGQVVNMMDPGYREAVLKSMSDFMPIANGYYREFLQSQCQFDTDGPY